MEFKKGNIEGLIEIRLSPLRDRRGFFVRTFDDNLFSENGIEGPWVQDNHSRSEAKYTLRGLHFILSPYTDGKLVRCLRGKILDLALDLRKASKTFGQYEFFHLSEDDDKIIYIPKGFAHGFLTMEENSEIYYKHNVYYKKEFDSGIKWNDKELNIDWPVKEPIISEKDDNLMSFKHFKTKYQGL